MSLDINNDHGYHKKIIHRDDDKREHPAAKSLTLAKITIKASDIDQDRALANDKGEFKSAIEKIGLGKQLTPEQINKLFNALDQSGISYDNDQKINGKELALLFKAFDSNLDGKFNEKEALVLSKAISSEHQDLVEKLEKAKKEVVHCLEGKKFTPNPKEGQFGQIGGAILEGGFGQVGGSFPEGASVGQALGGYLGSLYGKEKGDKESGPPDYVFKNSSLNDKPISVGDPRTQKESGLGGVIVSGLNQQEAFEAALAAQRALQEKGNVGTLVGSFDRHFTGPINSYDNNGLPYVIGFGQGRQSDKSENLLEPFFAKDGLYGSPGDGLTRYREQLAKQKDLQTEEILSKDQKTA